MRTSARSAARCRLWLFGALAACAAALPQTVPGMSMGRRRVQARTGEASDWAGEDAAAARNHMVYKDGEGMVKSCLGGPICGAADMSGDDTTSRAACESASRNEMDQSSLCQYRVEKYEACSNPMTALVVTLVLSLIGAFGLTASVVNYQGTQKEAALYEESGEKVSARVTRAWVDAANAGEKNRDRRTHFLRVEYVVKLPDADRQRAYAKVSKEFQAVYEFAGAMETGTLAEYMANKHAGDIVQVSTLVSAGVDPRAAELLGASGEYEASEGMGGDVKSTARIAIFCFLLMAVPIFFTVYDCGGDYLLIFVPCILAESGFVLKLMLGHFASKLSDPDGEVEYLSAKDGQERLVTDSREERGAPPPRAQRSEAVRPASQNRPARAPAPAPQLRETLVDRTPNPTSDRYDSDDEEADSDEDAV